MEEDTWLKVADAARLVGFSPSTLCRWADAGDIPCIKTRSGHRRFLKSDLEAYLERHRNVQRPTREAKDQCMGSAGVG